MEHLLPWLNLLLFPIVGYVMAIERRLTRLEAFREADRERRQRNPQTIT
jgi:hypothetical protein